MKQKIKFKDDWFIINANNKLYHRKTLGYLGHGVTKSHHEYLLQKVM
jgi:hypothetical protein